MATINDLVATEPDLKRANEENERLLLVLKAVQDWAHDPNRSAVSIDGFPLDDVDAALLGVCEQRANDG